MPGWLRGSASYSTRPHRQAGHLRPAPTTRKGLITRLPGRHHYQLTELGRSVAVLFTKAYGRVLTPGLTGLDPKLSDDIACRSELATTWRASDRSLDQFINAGLAAA